MANALNGISWKYIAGFFDAEGSITIAKFKTKTNLRYQLHVRLANKKINILKIICLYFGKSGYIKRISNSNEVFELAFIAKEAMTFLEKIEPFLVLKKKEAKLAISFQNSLVRTHGIKLTEAELIIRESIKNRMSEFHNRINLDYKKQTPAMLLPYMAGLIDGDGYIGILHENTLTVNLAAKNYSFLQNFKDTFGIGFISSRTDMHYWIISTKRASVFLSSLLPYLIIKKDEAKLAIRFQRSINSNNRNHLKRSVIGKRRKLISILKSHHLKKGKKVMINN